MAKNQIPSNAQEVSWGSAAALLTGCVVTLIGVAMDLPPMTILLRSFISGCVVGAMALIFAFGWQMVTPQREEE